MYGRKPTISQVIYHLLQAFATADYRFLIIFGNGRGLWYFQFGTTFFEIFSRFKYGHFKCIQLEPPTIVFEDFTLKSMIFENFSTVFYKGLCKGRLGKSLFFMAQNAEFGSIVPCVSVTLYSLKLYIKSYE